MFVNFSFFSLISALHLLISSRTEFNKYEYFLLSFVCMNVYGAANCNVHDIMNRIVALYESSEYLDAAVLC